MAAESSQERFASTLREVAGEVGGQVVLAQALGYSHPNLRKALSEPKRLLKLTAEELAEAARSLRLSKGLQVQLLERWHEGHQSAGADVTKPTSLREWEAWLTLSSALLRSGKDDEALAIRIALFVLGVRGNNAQVIAIAGRLAADLLRLRADYGQALLLGRRMLSSLAQDGESSHHYLLARYDFTLTQRALNPYSFLPVLQELDDLSDNAKPNDDLSHMILRDKLVGWWNAWLYGQDDPRPMMRQLLPTFEPREDDCDQAFFDHDAIARTATVLGADEQAERHIEVESRLCGFVAPAYRPKMKRQRLALAVVRGDKRTAERLRISQRAVAAPFGKYEHYQRDMDVLFARLS